MIKSAVLMMLVATACSRTVSDADKGSTEANKTTKEQGSFIDPVVLADIFGRVKRGATGQTTEPESAILFDLFGGRSKRETTGQTTESVSSLIEQIFGADTKPGQAVKGDNSKDKATEATETCVLEDTSEGICTPYYLCDLPKIEESASSYIIDIHASIDPCSSYLDVCCPPSAKKSA